MTNHRVVSQQEWLEARHALVAKEKALTRQQDEVASERRELPWVRVEKEYVFETPEGKKTLGELFGTKSQLMVYHFMFAPEWEEGCQSCSMVTDTTNGNVPHLAARDVAFTLVSRAPLGKLEAYKRRMGWTAPWVSSGGTEFNRDFGVTFAAEEVTETSKAYNFGTSRPYGQEMHGLSVFAKDKDGTIYRTYSTYGRGAEPLLAVYAMLDMAPKGRDEDSLPYPMAWVKRHDQYEDAKTAGSCCH